MSGDAQNGGDLRGQRARGEDQHSQVGNLFERHLREFLSNLSVFNIFIRNSCGSIVYEMFVSALGWEIELESHNGFMGGLSRQGCGSTCPYYATPYLEVKKTTNSC